jgi:tetratricopeptide (TPR) repeat protein
MVPPKRPASKVRAASGRQGGPGTFAGANYQTLVGVYEAVGLLGSLAAHPWHTTRIAVEPRVLGPNGQIGYDVALPDSRRRLEVKLSPTRADLEAFLSVVSGDPDCLDAVTTFEFVHAKGSRAISDLGTVVALSKESSDNEDFQSRSASLTIQQQALVERLGPEAWRRARQLRTTYMPVDHARKTIGFLTDRLYGDGPAQAVRDRLAARVSGAAEGREVLATVELKDELATLAGEMHLAPVADLTSLPRHLQAALVVLAELKTPVPLATLASVVGRDSEALASDLGPFVATTTSGNQPSVMLAFHLGALNALGQRELLACTLRLLLTIAGDEHQRPLALSQVPNIALLAERLVCEEPELVASSYQRAEKLFKTRGNLQLALRASRVALRASELTPEGSTRVTNEQLRDRAKTKICGESWVLQRIGDLEEAERVAHESLDLGERLGWSKNTAFCLKCLGRLQRMRAERLHDSSEQARLYADSERLLRDAAQQFAESAEFGPDHPEIGDCHSLLARTLFMSGRAQEAWRELGSAQDRLAAHRGQKDWADVLILEAEMLASESENDAAISRIGEALAEFPSSDDTDVTEIAARALALRGRILVRSDRVAAGVDLGRAADLYESLEDIARADQQRWEQMLVERRVPDELSQLLDAERVSVRVAAVHSLEAELAESNRRAAGQRRGLPAAFARQLVADARLEADRRERHWR